MEKNYISPIELIYCDMTTKTEDAVIEAIRKIGIDIDKSALIEALKQDRVRYEKAYQSGYDARDSEIVRCEDCKWHGTVDCPLCEAFDPSSPDDWYCPEGKRREASEDDEDETD